jgi:hypothetical protein
MSRRPQIFSKRYGHRPDVPISVREDAPEGFRRAVVTCAEMDAKMGIGSIVWIVRATLGKPPSTDWSDDYIRSDVHQLVAQCDWWQVYDIAEEIYLRASETDPELTYPTAYQEAVNDYCIANGIGWKMVGGAFEARTSDLGSALLQETETALHDAGKPTSADELRKALDALSRRPHSDITGAMQHAGASIECLARDLCGDSKLTLGDIIKHHPSLFPGAYRKLAESIWGITSNNGRHLAEGGEPTFNEAMLLVGVVTALANYLLSEHQPRAIRE